VKPGQVGELYVRNKMLVAGYHNDAAATEQSMIDGFFSVGDLARCDVSGHYFIEGRKRDMVISGGVNVYPAEVEGVLEQHPASPSARWSACRSRVGRARPRLRREEGGLEPRRGRAQGVRARAAGGGEGAARLRVHRGLAPKSHGKSAEARAFATSRDRTAVTFRSTERCTADPLLRA